MVMLPNFDEAQLANEREMYSKRFGLTDSEVN